jgi:hypothetical protein
MSTSADYTKYLLPFKETIEKLEEAESDVSSQAEGLFLKLIEQASPFIEVMKKTTSIIAQVLERHPIYWSNRLIFFLSWTSYVPCHRYEEESLLH